MMSVRPRYLLTLGAAGAALAAALLAVFVVGTSLRPVMTSPTTPPTLQSLTVASSTTSDTLTVVGSGTATATPDEAIVSIGVAATRFSVHDAVATANSDMSHLLGSLHGQGVVDKDIQTYAISINQQTNCCPSVVTGYTASNVVTVTIHHLNNVSGVLMAAVDAVGNDIQLNGVSLIVSNPSAALAKARAAAMADATARAQAWATLAGHHVGGIISLSEIVAVAPAYTCNSGCGGVGGGGFPVQPGQTSFGVTITATYELIA
jgi:uncharacterized protein